MKNIFEYESEIDEARGDYIRGLLGTTTDINALRTANPKLIKAFEDVLTYAKAEGKPIMGKLDDTSKTISELTTIDDLAKAVSIKNGLAPSSVAQFYKGLLKSPSTDIGIIKTIAPDLVGNAKFRGEYGAFATDKELIRALKTKQYSNDAVKEIVKAARKDAEFIKARTGGIAPRPGTPPAPTPRDKTIFERIKDKLRGLSWKKALGIAVASGLGGTALWYLMKGEGIQSEDFPPNPPEGSELFPECIQELINSGEGKIQKLSDGSSVVYYKEKNYYFYTNSKVKDVTNNIMGTYKCKGTKITTNESKKLKLYNILNEAIAKIDTNTLIDNVNDVISDLRGLYVSQSNLNNTINKLKKYIATNQGKQFLDLYQRSGFTDGSLRDRANAVFASDAGTVLKRDELLNLIDSIENGTATGTETETETNQEIGLGNIDITWNQNNNNIPGSTPDSTPGQRLPWEPNYFDCSQRDFPYQYGCISPKIAEIQKCHGIEPSRGYFGPKTRRTLGVNVITKEMYDSIMANCSNNKPDASAPIQEGLKKTISDKFKKDLEAIEKYKRR